MVPSNRRSGRLERGKGLAGEERERSQRSIGTRKGGFTRTGKVHRNGTWKGEGVRGAEADEKNELQQAQ
jgi:hypothetical protein